MEGQRGTELIKKKLLGRHDWISYLSNNFHFKPTTLMVGQQVGGKDFPSEWFLIILKNW